MQRLQLHSRSLRVGYGAVAAIAAAMLTTHSLSADQRFLLNERALSSLEFDGQQLPATLADFKQQFPHAQLDEGCGDAKAGLVCYTVTGWGQADTAQFLFCDERLYQFETRYSLDTLKKMGGAKVLLNKLLAAWGPADHAGESRWTWQRPMYSRRADYYAWPDQAKLTITDTSWTPVVTARLSSTRPQPPGNLGF
jgi:hypothetical protein